MSRYPPKRIDPLRLRELWLADVPLIDMASEFDCSMQHVSRTARTVLGLRPRQGSSRNLPWPAIFAAYQAGKSCRHIAADLRRGGITIDRTTIADGLRSRGVEIRQPLPPLDRAEIVHVVRLIRAGFSQVEIARQTGWTRNQVQHRRRAALPPTRDTRPIPIDVEAARALHQSGVSIREIATRLGCDRQTVTRRMFNLDRNGRRRPA